MLANHLGLSSLHVALSPVVLVEVVVPQYAHVMQVLRQVAVPVLFTLLGLVVVVVVCLLSSLIVELVSRHLIAFLELPDESVEKSSNTEEVHVDDTVIVCSASKGPEQPGYLPESKEHDPDHYF